MFRLLDCTWAARPDLHGEGSQTRTPRGAGRTLHASYRLASFSVTDEDIAAHGARSLDRSLTADVRPSCITLACNFMYCCSSGSPHWSRAHDSRCRARREVGSLTSGSRAARKAFAGAFLLEAGSVRSSTKAFHRSCVLSPFLELHRAGYRRQPSLPVVVIAAIALPVKRSMALGSRLRAMALACLASVAPPKQEHAACHLTVQARLLLRMKVSHPPAAEGPVKAGCCAFLPLILPSNNNHITTQPGAEPTLLIDETKRHSVCAS